jgi:uncharacterized protein YbjT (DUF2867 family)
MPEKVLVAGATGALGREVVLALKQHGHTVRAMGRNPKRLESLSLIADEQVVANALRPETLRGVCKGMTMVFSCVGASVIPMPQYGYATFSNVDTPANLHLIREAERSGITRFGYVSTFSKPNLQHLDFVKGHEKVVEALRNSTLDYRVIRPTGLFSAMEEILLVASRGLLPEFQGGVARTNPIHDADLAEFCVDALFGDTRERDVGGPEALTRRQIAELAYDAIGKTLRTRRVPVSALRGAGLLMRPFCPRMGHLFTFIADILVQDVVAPCYGTRTIGAFFREHAYKLE